MKKKKLIPLILTSAACFLLSFAFIGVGSDKKSVDAETTPDLSLSSFCMYDGSQIRLPANSNGTTYSGGSLRFMALIDAGQYADFETAYGEKAATDTTEWGIVFVQRGKMYDDEGKLVRDLTAENVFGYGDASARKYYWKAVGDGTTWATDAIGGYTDTDTSNKDNVADGKTMFTPVRYDNLEALNRNQWGNIINQNLSVDGQAGKAYYVISGAVNVPNSAYTTEVVARAYVRYSTDGGATYQYKFADYASGYMDNNSRSMTYVAQKYLDSDEGKADADKTYFDDTEKEGYTPIGHGQNNAVSQYINPNATVGYTIEYHFMDADGKSIVHTVEVDNSAYTINSNISMSAYEIIQMSDKTELQSLMEKYGSEIDWYNPCKIDVAKAYANNRTTFKLYYANELYAGTIGDSYDMLASMQKEDMALSWHAGIEGNESKPGEVQYDKAHTLGDDYSQLTVCPEHEMWKGGCKHYCENEYCDNPYHGHSSLKLTTELNNNTLLVNATLWNNELNDGAGGWDYMRFDENRDWAGGLNFADYEYILLRFYSNIGGISMRIIAGAVTDGGGNTVAETTGETYIINEGWNRIKIDGAAYQKVINAYAKAGGLMEDDKVNDGALAIYAPYRNYQYIQFLVNDDDYYGTSEIPAQCATWELYFEDVIGVKERMKKTSVQGFESMSLDQIDTGHLSASINTDKAFVTEGNSSLKLTANVTEDVNGNKTNWVSAVLPLEKDGGALTLSQLSQAIITFDIYVPRQVTVWCCGTAWSDNAPLVPNAWNTIRMNGWRLVYGLETYAKASASTYFDASTGKLLLEFGVGIDPNFEQGDVFYIDNLQASWITLATKEVALDDFETTPGRTDVSQIEKLEIKTNSWPGVATVTSKSDIITQPLWLPVEGAAGYQYIINNDGIIRTDCIAGAATNDYPNGYLCIPGGLMREGDTLKIRVVKRDVNSNNLYGDWVTYVAATLSWNSIPENIDNVNRLVAPTVTISEDGVATWNEVAGANGYEYQINNAYTMVNDVAVETVYSTTNPYVRLQDGDSISVRVKAVDSSNREPSVWTKPVVYNAAKTGEFYRITDSYYDANGNVILTTEMDKSVTIYDIAAVDGEVFMESSRIPSPMSGGEYAWKFTKGAVNNNGYLMVPITVGGQPLTTNQLLSIDYIELLVYAGANNNANGTIQMGFNGYKDSVNILSQKLLPGQWNTLRISGEKLYMLTQKYVEAMQASDITAQEKLNIINPYSNTINNHNGEYLSRLCGYATFHLIEVSEGDNWIFDGAKIVYTEHPVHSTHGSYWFTQHDFETMPITAYNALPPTYEAFQDSLDDLASKLEQNPDDVALQAAYESIEKLCNALRNQYGEGFTYTTPSGNTSYDALIEMYVSCGVNTMMGLYDYANYSGNGHDHVISMLEKCAENDLAYLLAWMGASSQTEELLESADAEIMKGWIIEYAKYAAMAGIMLTDEPGTVIFENLEKARESFEKYWGDDMLYHGNLLPNWVGSDAWLNYKSDSLSQWVDDSYTYEDYINDYIATYKPQVLSFDVYPAVSSGGQLYGTLNPCDGTMGDHVDAAHGSAISLNNQYVSEGTQSLAVTLVVDGYINIGTGGLTLEQMQQYESILVDIYNLSTVNITLQTLSGATLTVTPGWGTYSIPSDAQASIDNNNGGYIYLTNTTGDAVTFCVDNVRGGNPPYLRQGYYKNLATIREASIKANIPFWAYIQTSMFEGQRKPTESDLLWNVNTALAYGAKGIQYFNGVEPYPETNTNDIVTRTFTGGLFSANGTPTDIYYYAQKANMFIQSVDHVLMNSKNIGVMYSGNLPQFYSVSNGVCTALDTTANGAEVPTSGTIRHFGNDTSLGYNGGYGGCYYVDGNVMVGCFNYNGKTAFYVVNNSITNWGGANLLFTSARTGTIYGMSGSSAYITNYQSVTAQETNDLTYSCALSTTTKGSAFATDYGNKLLVQNLKPGEAFLVVMD